MRGHMEQLEFFIVPSPCIGWCQLNEIGFCKGCFRTRQERFGWNQLTNSEKQKVARLCKQRKMRQKKQIQLRKKIYGDEKRQLSLFQDNKKSAL